MAKNIFMFPLFYGSWYKLAAKGLSITEEHVKKCETNFWKMYLKTQKYWGTKNVKRN